MVKEKDKKNKKDKTTPPVSPSEFFNEIYQAKLFYDESPFSFDDSKIWWSWDKDKFKWIKSDEVKILGDIYNNEGINIVKYKLRGEVVNALKHVGRERQPKTPPSKWIQFREKIYDIETGESFDCCPEYFMTNPIPYNLGESEDTPTIDKLFTSWVGEEHKQELYEIIAFAQAPKYFIHRIICLIGSGANGKTTYLRFLRNYLGDDNVVSPSLQALMGIRFEGSKLYKKLVCLMGETNFGTLTQTEFIKSLSGEDKTRVEFKGKDGFDAVNNAKLILATNSLPQTADKTDGFYRRWKIINFGNTFKKEKDVLSQIPKIEYENLARKCFRILQELWKDRIFTNDGNFEDRKKAYEKHSNPMVIFIEENFEKDINSDYLSEDFREAYLDFLKMHGFREVSPKAITQQLKINGYEVRQLNRNKINRKFILGLKKKDVSDVSNISVNPISSIYKGQNESSDTNDVSDISTGKQQELLLKQVKNKIKIGKVSKINQND